MRDFDALNPGDVIEKWEELEKEHDSLQDAIDEAASTVETWQNSLASAERDAEEAAHQLKSDYTSYTLNGKEYWCR